MAFRPIDTLASQFCVVARTNFAVSVAQTLTARALILQAIKPCASVWVWLRETNYAGIMPDAFRRYLAIMLKLCWFNRPGPSCSYLEWIF